MAKDKHPATQAVRVLREHGVAFTAPSLRVRGTRRHRRFRRASSASTEHAVIKTLVMEDDAKRPLVVLMHGDREVSTKNLARHIGVKTDRAVRAGGGRPPLGLPGRRHQPVRDAEGDARLHGAERSPTCRGSTSTAAGAATWSGMTPADLVRVLKPMLVDVAATADRSTERPVTHARRSIATPISLTPGSGASFATLHRTHGAPNSPVARRRRSPRRSARAAGADDRRRRPAAARRPPRSRARRRNSPERERRVRRQPDLEVEPHRLRQLLLPVVDADARLDAQVVDEDRVHARCAIAPCAMVRIAGRILLDRFDRRCRCSPRSPSSSPRT